jgi:hypothetical protein
LLQAGRILPAAGRDLSLFLSLGSPTLLCARCVKSVAETPTHPETVSPPTSLLKEKQTHVLTNRPALHRHSLLSRRSLKSRRESNPQRPGPLLLAYLEIKPVMFPAPRVESRPAHRTTRLALHIPPNAQLRRASPAKYRCRIPLTHRPHLNRMTRQLDMTILASVINPAASHLDRDDVRRPVIMPATRLPIHIHSAHLW